MDSLADDQSAPRLSGSKQVAAICGLFQLIAVAVYPRCVALVFLRHTRGCASGPLDDDMFASRGSDGRIRGQTYRGDGIINEKHVYQQQPRAIVFGVHKLDELFIAECRRESKKV